MTELAPLYYTSAGGTFSIATYMTCEIGFNSRVVFAVKWLWPSANELYS